MDTHVAPRYAPIETALGPGWFAYTERGAVLLSTRRSERAFLAEAKQALGVAPIRKDPPASFMRAVCTSAERGDGSAVDWSMLPPFQRRVLEACARIPAGSVASYSDVARMVHNPRAARAVGTALARNPVPLLVPCHRVVRADGKIGNYGLGGDKVKRALLRSEGYTD